MALITCPECGKQVSDRVAACIHCGCPIPQEDNLILCGKPAGPINKPIYYFYDQQGNLFDMWLWPPSWVLRVVFTTVTFCAR